MSKEDVFIIGASANCEVMTIRRRYDDEDHEHEIHKTLRDQVISDTNKERNMLEELGYVDMVLTKVQALRLMLQLKSAFKSDLKIFATES